MEAQLEASSLIPNCNIVSTTDIGDDWCIHPKAKDIVGFRLAHMALKETYGHYGDDIPATGPVYKKHIWKDNRLKIFFDQPLTALPEGVEGLELEYADGSETSISGRVAPRDSSVIIECPDRSEVKYVRYAYRNVSPANLKNIYGFPVFPFRKCVEQ